MTEERQLTIDQVQGVMPDARDLEAVEQQRGGTDPEPPAEAEIDLPVHPVAALFPMLSERELDDLAADIRENGLIHAVMLDDEGRIIDGRNRYVACRRADVKPRFGKLNGQEPVAFILSQNLARRHMTQGQRAMAVAMSREKSKNEIPDKVAAPRLGVSAAYLAQANVVLTYTRDLAEKVLAGTQDLPSAYTQARTRKEAAMSEDAKRRRLARYAPDLAALVAEGKLTLAAAEMEMAQRRAREEQAKIEAQRYRIGLTQDWVNLLAKLDPRAMDPEENARQWLACDPALLARTDDIGAERARLCADTLLRYARMKEGDDGG